jgi:hypothetical protein
MSREETIFKRKVAAPPKEPFPPEALKADGTPNFEHPWWDFLEGVELVP